MSGASSDPESHFNPILNGKFMSRHGGAGPSAIRSEMKVCFVATDKPFLVELLYQLSLRKDCCSVKYSVFPRDGMYLGRCFLTSEDAAGRLCAEYKGHHKLMVSIQDDDFFNVFAELGPPNRVAADEGPQVPLGLVGVRGDTANEL